MQDEVKVSQIDKDASVDLAHALDMSCEEFTSGGADILVQAFARHRHQAERETLARMEWRDIESAPAASGKEQGNLRILVIGGLFEEATIVLADGEWWRKRAKEGAKSVPTHWMPLPPAPEAGQ